MFLKKGGYQEEEMKKERGADTLFRTMEFLMTLWHSPIGAIWTQFWAPNLFHLILQELWFFWDLGLMLFDVPKDAVFAETLVFSSIFDFRAVNWASKWTKSINFQCVPFEPNFKILKDFSNNVLVLLDYLWPQFHHNQTIFGGTRAKKTQIISQPHTLYWWYLPQIYILIRSFIWQNLGV